MDVLRASQRHMSLRGNLARRANQSVTRSTPSQERCRSCGKTMAMKLIANAEVVDVSIWGVRLRVDAKILPRSFVTAATRHPTSADDVRSAIANLMKGKYEIGIEFTARRVPCPSRHPGSLCKADLARVVSVLPWTGRSAAQNVGPK